MTENEFLLEDRKQKIISTIEKYGEDNFYISFSGGKDSTVLSYLVDLSIPGNQIPRVYVDTGIELNMVRDFVHKKKECDNRFVILKPQQSISCVLKEKGYPFKSKQHSKWLDNYQRKGMYEAIKNYIGEGQKHLYRPCPKQLKYQFSDDFKIRVSDKCCTELKEKPLDRYAKENKKAIKILGIMKEEGGRRMNAVCLAFSGKSLKSFQPMTVVTKEWENWLIDEYDISICDIYKPPYNEERTGCKGCPFALNLQKELDMLEKWFPHERKQCEIIWKPIYDEYRRIGYRLKTDYYEQITMQDYLQSR